MTRPYNQNHHLTDEQKQIAEDNIGLMYWYLNSKLVATGKIKKHEIDEVTEYLQFSYCLSIEKYVPEKGKLSTYIEPALKHGYVRYRQLKSRYNDRYTNVDFCSGDKEEVAVFSVRCNEPAYIEQKKHLKWDDISWLFNEIEMTPFESQVVYLYWEMKYTLQKVGEALGYTRSRIGQVVEDVTNKLKKFVIEKEYDLEDFLSVC